MKTLKNQFYAISAGLLLLLTVPQNAFAINLREELLFSAVQIVGIDDTGAVSTGTGTTINKNGLVLTNYHVVANMDTDEIFPQINLCYTISQYLLPRCAATAKVVALNKEFDLALIKPDKKIAKDGKPTKLNFLTYWKKSGNQFYSAPFQNTDNAPLPNILDRITIWGYPSVGGSTITVTQGYVSGFDVVEQNDETLVKFIKTDAEVSPGNSGGAAFNEWFSFIGVPSNAWAGQLGFIIPVQTVMEWLQSLDKQKIINIKTIDSFWASKIFFSDINKNDSFRHIAALMKHLKIINGYEDGTFKPDQPLNFSEAITIIAAAKRVERDQIADETKIKSSALIRDDEFFNLLGNAFLIPVLKNTFGKPITRRQAANAIFELIIP